MPDQQPSKTKCIMFNANDDTLELVYNEFVPALELGGNLVASKILIQDYYTKKEIHCEWYFNFLTEEHLNAAITAIQKTPYEFQNYVKRD